MNIDNRTIAVDHEHTTIRWEALLRVWPVVWGDVGADINTPRYTERHTHTPTQRSMWGYHFRRRRLFSRLVWLLTDHSYYSIYIFAFLVVYAGMAETTQHRYRESELASCGCARVHTITSYRFNTADYGRNMINRTVLKYHNNRPDQVKKISFIVLISRAWIVVLWSERTRTFVRSLTLFLFFVSNRKNVHNHYN